MSYNKVSGYFIHKIIKYIVSKGFNIYIPDNPKFIQRAMKKDAWISAQERVQFMRCVCNHFKLDAYSLGFQINSNSQFDGVQIGLLRLLPISRLTNIVTNHIQDSTNKNTIVKITYFNRKQKILMIQTKPVQLKYYYKQFCDYNRGVIIRLMTSKGYQDISICQNNCRCNGHKECQYVIQWADKKPMQVFKLIYSFFKMIINYKDKIPEYVWKQMGNRPKTIDDVKNICAEQL